jgi:glycosyltransferase involved in cell wall biosynthesis
MRALFVGRGQSGVCWYRAALPAIELGCDWLGVTGEPGALRRHTGARGLALDERAWDGYDVVVLQLVSGARWVRRIEELRRAGVAVLYEIDDDLHAVAGAAEHEFALLFDHERLRGHEAAMGACDGIIVSTPALADRYAPLGPPLHVCQNGIDLPRYSYARPQRDTVTIGWAGGTGHGPAVRPWLDAVADVLAAVPETRLCTIGQPFALTLADRFGPDRCTAIPFGALDTYPAAMAAFDIALAPAAPGPFFAAKSDLRALEAAALGLPVVADPRVYGSVRDGVTGLHAVSPDGARACLLTLVGDAALRARMGAAAREWVTRERSMPVAARRWGEVLRGAVRWPAAV